MKNIKRFSFVLGIIAVIVGLLGISPASATDGDNGFQFTVIDTSHGTPTVSTSLSNTQEALVNGATQMLWQDADFNGHLTVANVKQAFKYRIKVNATGANSSQVIYRLSHHRKEVVTKPGSKVRNTGLHNNIRGGFVWTTGLAVLRYDKPSHQYRHAANLLTDGQFAQVRKDNPHKVFKVIGRVKLGHKVYNIVVWCGNFIGGNVTMFPYVVQVPSLEDLIYKSDAKSIAGAKVTFDFEVSCPSNGARFTAQGYAWAFGEASSQITYTQRTRSGVISGLENAATQNLSINQSTQADAQASVQISGSCGSTTPPPPAHQNPTAELFVGEHAVDLYGTMPVFGRVKAFDGSTGTLGSPVVTPSDLGMISNWRTVSTERDGVTPCETGYVCYQGTFRVTKDGTPGTYSYGTLQTTATDTMGGSFTTQPLQFSVYYAIHPNT